MGRTKSEGPSFSPAFHSEFDDTSSSFSSSSGTIDYPDNRKQWSEFNRRKKWVKAKLFYIIIFFYSSLLIFIFDRQCSKHHVHSVGRKEDPQREGKIEDSVPNTSFRQSIYCPTWGSALDKKTRNNGIYPFQNQSISFCGKKQMRAIYLCLNVNKLNKM